MRSLRKHSEGGYALLMVFLMAAMVALMLYQQLPRVAFETEREKEQLLIDRGEQYIRAIQLYYISNNRQYPTSIDDLERREKRFLRRRYIDPYTGKDEWRIIHTSGAFLTDSLVQKPPGASDDKSKSASNTTSNTNAPDEQPQVNAAVLQRPSDRPLTPPPGFAQSFPGQDPSAQPNNGPLPPITLAPQQGPGALPPITLQPGGGNQPGLPPITLAPIGAQGGQQVTGQNPGQIPGQQVTGQIPGQQVTGQNPGQISGQLRPPVTPGPNQITPFPGQPGPGGGVQTGLPPGFRIDANGQLVPVTPAPGQGIPGQAPGIPGGIPGQTLGIPGIPGQPFSPQPGQPGNQPANQTGGAQNSPNAALELINQLLTNPRGTTSTPISGNQIGGIAGIASTHKGPSIKVYKDQGKYELWEFVFSPTASTVPIGGASGPGGPGGRGGVNPGGGQPGGQPSIFSPGGQGGFGAGGGGRGGPGQPGGIFQTNPPGR